MKESAKALWEQNRKLFGLGVLTFFGFVIFIFIDFESPQSNEKELSDAKIDLPADKISPQNIWMNKIEASNQLLEQRLKYLESLLVESKKQEIEHNTDKEALQKNVEYLRKELQEMSKAHMKQMHKPLPEETVYSGEIPFFYQDSSSEEVMEEPIEIILREPLREMIMPEGRDKVHHVDEMIPAGTTVKALLVSSLDAVCGVYSTSDPTPIKLRILDNGHLPKQVNVKLKGGIIIGSAYGNISSERVYMRLERLTQVQKNGDFIETDVAGYVSGEDGKYGVRGLVVDKSAKAVRNAATSGFLAGVSNALQTAFSRRQVDSSNNYNIGVELASQGGTSGTSSGLDMLADYYIKRAEQIQPVIQVNAGRIVDVTFTLGVSTGDLHSKEYLKKLRQSNRD